MLENYIISLLPANWHPHTNKMQDNDYNRPRRPNTDTLSYLKSLPFNEATAHKEIEAYIEQKKKVGTNEDDEDNLDYPQNLSAAISALDVLRVFKNPRILSVKEL